MNTVLFPRLTKLAVQRTLQELQAKIDSPSAQAFIRGIPGKSYGASGGSRIDENFLSDLCSRILSIATNNGYPLSKTSKSRSNFDNEVCIELCSLNTLRSGELLRNDVWAYIATAMLPSVVIWRFKLNLEDELSNAALSRFNGGARNTFQRLWVRKELFDRGEEHPDRWALLKSLPEDAIIQITERPSLSASKALSLAIAEEWLISKNRSENTKISSEELMRQTVILIRLQNETLELSIKTEISLRKFIAKAFSKAAAMINANKS